MKNVEKNNNEPPKHPLAHLPYRTRQEYDKKAIENLKNTFGKGFTDFFNKRINRGKEDSHGKLFSRERADRRG